MSFRTIASGILIILFSFFIVPVALAHGDEPRLEISVEKLNPGGVIEVRGVDFELEELVALDLIGSDFELPLGEVTADVEGVFVQIVTLPMDLQEGTYNFRATTDDHDILSPSFLVWGMAVLEVEEEGQREEEDGLFAPMPTFSAGVVPGSVSQTEAQLTHQGVPTSNRNSTVFIGLTLVVMGILAVLGIRVTRKK